MNTRTMITKNTSAVPVVCWLVTVDGHEGTTTSEVEAALADTAVPLVRMSDHLAAIVAATH